jgi:hypothetical protein
MSVSYIYIILLFLFRVGKCLLSVSVDLFPSYNVDYLPDMDRVSENGMSELHTSHSKIEFTTQ